MSVKRLVKLRRKGPKKKPSSRDDLLSGIDYVLLSGGGSLVGGFTVERPSGAESIPASLCSYSDRPDYQQESAA